MSNDYHNISLDEAINNADFIANSEDVMAAYDCRYIKRVIDEVFSLAEKVATLNKQAEDIATVRAAAKAERDQLVKELKLANLDGFGRTMNGRIDSIIARYANGAMIGNKKKGSR